VEHYSAIKKNEIMLFAGKLMELKIVMLREVSQAQEEKVGCFFSYMEDQPKINVYIITHTY
jgi:hypothetical protein